MCIYISLSIYLSIYLSLYIYIYIYSHNLAVANKDSIGPADLLHYPNPKDRIRLKLSLRLNSPNSVNCEIRFKLNPAANCGTLTFCQFRSRLAVRLN